MNDWTRLLRALCLGAKRSWTLAAGVVLIVVALGAGFIFSSKPIYVATAQLYVSPRGVASASDLSAAVSYAEQAVSSMAALVNTSYVLAPAARELGGAYSVNRLTGAVSGNPIANTSLIVVSARSNSAVESARVANEVARQLALAAATLAKSSTTNGVPIAVTPVQAAQAPSRPDSPNVLLDFLLSGLVGLALAAAVIAVRELAETRVTTLAEAADVLQTSQLGAVPRLGRDAGVIRGGGAAAESIRDLRTSLHFAQSVRSASTVMVTSSVSGEGKSTVACSLAIAYAESGRSVLLIDADMRRPRVAPLMGVDGAVGLSNVVSGMVDFRGAIQSWGGGPLSVLPAGDLPPNPSELLDSPAMQTLLASAADTFELVVIDAPPVLPVADATVLASKGLAILFVARSGLARRSALRSSLRKLQAVNALVLGVVLNGAKASRSSPSQYYDYSTVA